MRRYLNNWVSIVGIAVTVNFVLLGLVKPSDGATETVLYSFRNPGNTGIQPYHPLTPVLVGADGTLYGTTANGGGGACGSPGCGTAYTLTPPALAGGAWMQNTIATFSVFANSAFPSALTAGANGVLFGTTTGIGHTGLLFQLTPPINTGDSWTTTFPYTFSSNGLFGLSAFSPLIMDSSGRLYGTAASGNGSFFGGVFGLAPKTSGSSWSQKILRTFTGRPDPGFTGGALEDQFPAGGLLARNGAFYGVTDSGGDNDYGAVYKLTPPKAVSSGWTETVIYSFTNAEAWSPEGALVADANGVLYGVARSGNGAIFALTPPNGEGAPWTESVIYNFAGGSDGSYPNPGLLIRHGTLYGTTYEGGTGQNPNCVSNGCGTIFALIPPSTLGDPWTETLLHTFTGLDGDGARPMAALTAGPHGVLYGTTYSGGAGGIGTVFQITP